MAKHHWQPKMVKNWQGEIKRPVAHSARAKDADGCFCRMLWILGGFVNVRMLQKIEINKALETGNYFLCGYPLKLDIHNNNFY